MIRNGLWSFSLRSQGARHQLPVAIALVAVIPFLSFSFIAVAAWFFRGTYAVWVQTVISLLALAIGLSGYLMLRRYPRNMESLRTYLKDIAAGELRGEISLGDDMDDVTAIARYLNMIRREMQHKMELLEKQLMLSQEMQETIKKQAQQLLEAERHRVMIESLGTACHHIGQPATVLRLYIDSIARENVSVEARERIEECRQAIESIADILHRLSGISEYRTVPYVAFHPADSPANDSRLIDINQRAEP